jgi:hypothetical protein
MTRRLIAVCALLAMSVACMTGSAHAQVTGPTGILPPGAPSQPPATSFSEADLEAALRAQDPGLKLQKREVRNRYTLDMRVGNETHRVVLYTRFRENRVIVKVPLTKPLNPRALPADLQARLDQLNLTSAPAKLVLSPNEDGTLTVRAEMDISRPTTLQELQAKLDQLLRTVEWARPVWGPLGS